MICWFVPLESSSQKKDSGQIKSDPAKVWNGRGCFIRETATEVRSEVALFKGFPVFGRLTVTDVPQVLRMPELNERTCKIAVSFCQLFSREEKKLRVQGNKSEKGPGRPKEAIFHENSGPA